MICSRCSLGAALLVEARKWHEESTVILDTYNVVRENPQKSLVRHLTLFETLANELHRMCEYSNCACQHHTNVREGIDWSKVKGQGNFQHDVQGVTVNGINQNDEKAAREV